MNQLKIDRRIKTLLASASAVLLASGCGGSVEPGAASQDAMLRPAQYSTSSTGAAQAAGMPAHADTNSFTLKPASEFKGFNPEIWNDRKSWYECDCGRQSQKQPRKMEWNPV